MEELELHQNSTSIVEVKAIGTSKDMGEVISSKQVLLKPVKSLFFCNKEGSKITYLPFEDDEIRIKIQFESTAKGKECFFRIRNIYKEHSVIIETKKFIINELNPSPFTYAYTGVQFNNGGTAVQCLYVEIFVGEKWGRTTRKSVNLNVSIVHFVPRIMKTLGWNYGAKTQTDWFKAKYSRQPWLHQPKLNYISIDWALSFSRIKKFYNKEIVNEKIWKSESSIKSLRNEINKYFNDKAIALPSKEDQKIPFNLFGSSIVKEKNTKHPKLGININELMPEFEVYYFRNISYEISLMEELDDLFGALGSFLFRLSAKGEIEYKNGKRKVRITAIGIYIKDSFDFFNDHEYLGIWDPVNNRVSSGSPLNYWTLEPFPPYYRITNNLYNQWQNFSHDSYGGHFHLYSDIKEIPEYFEFYL